MWKSLAVTSSRGDDVRVSRILTWQSQGTSWETSVDVEAQLRAETSAFG